MLRISKVLREIYVVHCKNLYRPGIWVMRYIGPLSGQDQRYVDMEQVLSYHQSLEQIENQNICIYE